MCGGEGGVYVVIIIAAIGTQRSSITNPLACAVAGAAENCAVAVDPHKSRPRVLFKCLKESLNFGNR
jgi:hypothetical protein